MVINYICSENLGAICCAQPIVCDLSYSLRQRLWFPIFFRVNFYLFIFLFRRSGIFNQEYYLENSQFY